MQRFSHASLAITLALLSTTALAACGSTTDTTTDSGTVTDTGTVTDRGTVTDTGTATDRGTATDTGTATDSGTVTVTDASGPPMVSGVYINDGMPVADATIAVVGASPALATTTSSTGVWSLTLPSVQSVFFRATKASLRTVQQGFAVPAAGIPNLNLQVVANDQASQIFSKTGVTESAAAGIVVAVFNMAGGAGGELPGGFGATLSAGGGTPVALGDMGPVRSAVTIRNNTLIVANVTAGMTSVTATAPAGHTCAPSPNALTTVRVDPGVLTFVSFDCN